MAHPYHPERTQNWSQPALGLQLVSRRCRRLVQCQNESSEGVWLISFLSFYWSWQLFDAAEPFQLFDAFYCSFVTAIMYILQLKLICAEHC